MGSRDKKSQDQVRTATDGERRRRMQRPHTFEKIFWPALVLVLAMLRVSIASMAEEKRTPVGASQISTSNAGQMEKIVTDRKLWGEDAFAVFGTLAHWKNAGETSIVIFPDRVAGGTKWETLESAKQSLTRMVDAMKRPLPRLQPKYDAI